VVESEENEERVEERMQGRDSKTERGQINNL
jgi:hypothetical protein